VKTLWFGLGPDNDLRAEEIRTDLDGISFMAVGLGQRIPVRLPVPGEHNVMNALAALLAAHCVGVPLEPAAAALADFKNTGNRMRIFEAKGFTLLADCYNAGPESTPAALKVLRDRPARGRRIAVLGDMLELGAHAPESHRMVGELAAQCADRVLAYGPLSVDIAAGAGAKGEHFLEKEQLLAALRALARPGDAILFKASHSMHLEQVLDQFTE
jgi:UDP-N-acetylmuramoyl-tripeptide--D-alanyl-D-alanine ligase